MQLTQDIAIFRSPPGITYSRRACVRVAAFGSGLNGSGRERPSRFDDDRPRPSRSPDPPRQRPPPDANGFTSRRPQADFGRHPGPQRRSPSPSDNDGPSHRAQGGSPYPQGPSFARDASAPSKRDAQERAARKAARIAEKTATAERNSQGCCYGCGARLQIEVPQGPGYVAPDKYAVKKQRRQLDKVLCQRCSDLCNGAMIPAVQDFTQKLQIRQTMSQAGTVPGSSSSATAAPSSTPNSAGSAAGAPRSTGPEAEALNLLGKVLVTPEQLRAQLTPLALRAAVVVLLVDLTDASGTLMSRVRDMVGRNPIILVGTKIDLLPEGCHPRDVAEWLSGAAASKKLNVVSTHLVSSHTGQGMSAVVARICGERKSRDVYVVGAANVGKSAFVRAMLKEMARTEPVAIGTGKYLPVESAMPGTTLGLIPLKAFSSGGILFDTPGVHLHHRIPHMLSPPELKLLHPRRPLTVHVPALPAELSEEGLDDDADTGRRTAATSEAGTALGASAGPEEDGAVRLGRGGLKIVSHAPTDEYGVPIVGLDAGIRRGSGAGGKGVRGEPQAESLAAQQQQQQRVKATYMWSDLVRIDVLSGPPDAALVFYGPATMRTVALPFIRPDQQLEVDYDGSGGAPGKLLVCTESVAARGGLQPQDLVVKATGGSGGAALADVAISGLPGWVAVWAPRAKKDVRLRVWAPRGVEVLVRPAFPSPLPRALQRAWRGERGAGESGDEDEEAEERELDEWARALAKGGMGDPTKDPQWWESMAALKDEDLPGYNVSRRWGAGAAGSRKSAAAVPAAQDDDDDDLPDWDEEAELLEEEDGDEKGRTVVVSATVEDILRRPRLDVLAQMDMDVDEDEDDEEDEEEDDEISGFTLTKAADGKRRVDGPSGDGSWNPLKASGEGAPSKGSAGSASEMRRGTVTRGSALRRGKVTSKASDVEEAEAEGEDQQDEEGDWGEAEVLEAPAASARRRGAGGRPLGGARLWLSRRRRSKAVSVSGDDGEQGEVE